MKFDGVKSALSRLTRKQKIASGVAGVILIGGIAGAVGGENSEPAPEPEVTVTQEAKPEATKSPDQSQLDAKTAAPQETRRDTKAATPEEEALEVIEPVPAEITDSMLASAPNVYRGGNAAAVQDPETGLYVIAIEAWVDGDPQVIRMGRESLEPGPSRQWTLDKNAEEALPRVPKAMDSSEGRTLILSDAFETAYNAAID